MQEQEQRQRELLDKIARARGGIRPDPASPSRDAPDAIFAPLPDIGKKRLSVVRLFFSVYDNLGTLIAINVFTFALTLPLLLVLFTLDGAARRHLAVTPLLPLLLVGLLAAPGWAAASSICAAIVDEQLFTLRDYWSAYRRFLGKAIVLAVAQWAIGGALFFATGWYLGQRALAPRLIGIVSLYLCVFWALAGLYVWPLLVRGYRWRSVLRNALVLVVAAPVRSVGILLTLLICTAILAISGIGVVVLLFSLWAMLPNQALVMTRERLEQRNAESAARG